jgi:hypothetical protein
VRRSRGSAGAGVRGLQSAGTMSPGRTVPSRLRLGGEPDVDGMLELSLDAELTLDAELEGLEDTAEDDDSGSRLGGAFRLTWWFVEVVADVTEDFCGELSALEDFCGDDGPEESCEAELAPADGQPAALEPPTLLPHLLPGSLPLRRERECGVGYRLLWSPISQSSMPRVFSSARRSIPPIFGTGATHRMEKEGGKGSCRLRLI